MTRRGSTRRERLGLPGWAALLVVSLVVGACQAATPGSPAVSTSAEPSLPAASAASPSPAAPAARLAAAFTAMAGGYTYDTSVTVGGAPVSHASGRWVHGAGEFTLESGGQSVTYRAIPPRAWVLKPGASWVEVAGNLPTGDPVADLATPQAVTVVSDASDALVVDATYPPSALGLTGSDPVSVRISIVPDGATTATYTADTAAGPAVSTTTLRPATGLAPVATPSPVPSGG